MKIAYLIVVFYVAVSVCSSLAAYVNQLRYQPLGFCPSVVPGEVSILILDSRNLQAGCVPIPVIKGS